MLCVWKDKTPTNHAVCCTFSLEISPQTPLLLSLPDTLPLNNLLRFPPRMQISCSHSFTPNAYAQGVPKVSPKDVLQYHGFAVYNWVSRLPMWPETQSRIEDANIYQSSKLCSEPWAP